MKKYYLLVVILFVISIPLFSCFYGRKTRSVFRGNQLMVSIDGKKASSFPTSGNYYLAHYDCNNKNTVVSWNKDTYQLMVSNHHHKGGVSCYLDFQSFPKLADMEVGAFVSYNGTNGCIGDACFGKNANSGNGKLGYCGNHDSQFYYDGYRIAYFKDNMAYLVSAGAVECMCTSSDGGNGKDCVSSVSSSSLSNHLQNMNAVALKYCNRNYVAGGVCNHVTTRSISDSDFDMMVGKGLAMGACYGLQNGKCGYFDDLIDIGSNYWYYNTYDGLSNYVLYWDSYYRMISRNESGSSYGIRPIIKMDPNVFVVGGSGTYDDPYQIANYAFNILTIDRDKKNIKLEMFANANNVSKMCINLNSTVCTNYVPYSSEYVLDIGKANEKDNIIYVYYQDKDGNVISSIERMFSL